MAGGNIKVVVRGKQPFKSIEDVLTKNSTAFQWQGGGSASKMRRENGWKPNNTCASTRS